MRQLACCLLLTLLGLSASSVGQTTRITPQIVAKFHLLRRAELLPPITVFTPKLAGVFRVSTVMVLTLGNGSVYGEWTGMLGFTDEGGPGTMPATLNGLLTSTAGAIASGVSTVTCRAGTPLTFSTSNSGDWADTKYDVFIVVERLM
jgi:hypothetical protein